MKLYITADFNDGDYGNILIDIDGNTFNKFKPLIDAINKFQPYIRHDEFGGVDYHNWNSCRQDLGELSLYEKYNQFDKNLIDEFNKIFIWPIPTPFAGMEGELPHTIVSIKDVITDIEYINIDGLYQRYDDKILSYFDELNRICSYKRKSDGKSLCSIPYAEMTDYENQLIQEKDNLWKKYI